MIVGIFAAVLLAAGLLPPYGELWKRRGRVIGLNWVKFTSQIKKKDDANGCRYFSPWTGLAPSSLSWR